MQLKDSCNDSLKCGDVMASKEKLLEKLFGQSDPKNFTVHDLEALMKKCNCISDSGGRGSSIIFCHQPTQRVLQFDGPHPGKELYRYQVKMVKAFLQEVGEA